MQATEGIVRTPSFSVKYSNRHRNRHLIARPWGPALGILLVSSESDRCSYWTVWQSSLRAESRFAPSQWEMALLCNAVSHWLGASLESALSYFYKPSNITWYCIALDHDRSRDRSDSELTGELWGVSCEYFQEKNVFTAFNFFSSCQFIPF